MSKHSALSSVAPLCAVIACACYWIGSATQYRKAAERLQVLWRPRLLSSPSPSCVSGHSIMLANSLRGSRWIQVIVESPTLSLLLYSSVLLLFVHQLSFFIGNGSSMANAAHSCVPVEQVRVADDVAASTSGEH